MSPKSRGAVLPRMEAGSMPKRHAGSPLEKLAWVPSVPKRG